MWYATWAFFILTSQCQTPLLHMLLLSFINVSLQPQFKSKAQHYTISLATCQLPRTRTCAQNHTCMKLWSRTNTWAVKYKWALIPAKCESEPIHVMFRTIKMHSFMGRFIDVSRCPPEINIWFISLWKVIKSLLICWKGIGTDSCYIHYNYGHGVFVHF